MSLGCIHSNSLVSWYGSRRASRLTSSRMATYFRPHAHQGSGTVIFHLSLIWLHGLSYIHWQYFALTTID